MSGAWRTISSLCCGKPLSIFLLFVISIGLTGLTSYLVLDERIRRDMNDELSAIADVKARQVGGWLADRRNFVKLRSQEPLFLPEIEKWIASSDPQLERRLRTRLDLDRGMGFDAVEFLDIDGRQLIETGDSGYDVHFLTPDMLKTALTQEEPLMIDLHQHGDAKGTINLAFLVPARDAANPKGAPAGFYLFSIDARTEFYPMLSSWPRRSQSGEVFIVRKEGDVIRAVSELRHRENSAMTFSLPLSYSHLPAAQAFLRGPGIYAGRDYRGVEVMTAARAVEGTPWMLLAKIDRDEVFADHNRLVLAVFSTVAAAILVCGLLMMMLWRQQRLRAALAAVQQAHIIDELENRFRITLTSIGDAVIATDRDGKVDFLNPVAEAMTGWTMAQAKGLPLEDIFDIRSEDTGKTVENPVQQVLRDGIVVGLANHTMLMGRHGRNYPIADSGSPIRDESGDILGVVLVFRDQSVARDAARALEESELTYRSLFDHMLNGLAYCKMLYDDGKPTDFIYLSVNQGFERLTGRLNVEGKLVSEVIPGIRESDPRLFEIYGKVARGAPPETFEIFVEALKMWFSISVYSPKPDHFVAVFDVITERKTAEQELERYRLHLEELIETRTLELQSAMEKSRLILESSADGIFGTDSEGKVIFINSAACAMLGYSALDLQGKRLHDLVHHLKADGITAYPWEECPSCQAINEGRSVRSEEIYWRADGMPLPVRYACHPIQEAGSISGVVVSFSDIAIESEARKARETALAEARHLARVRRDFLANMSHEIRTPLNAVLGLAQVGLRERDAAKAQDSLLRISEAGQSLKGIIDDILDFSKIEAGHLKLENSPLLIGQIVDRAVSQVAVQAYDKGLKFVIDEASGLPLAIMGDVLRLTQILSNLLSNAIKFTSAGGEVALSVSQEDMVLVFKVRDTGIGLTDEQKEHLFQPFEQGDSSTTRHFGGTGLGLSICHNLVTLMGGSIGAESVLGKGSTFEVRLSLLEADMPAPPKAKGSVVLAGLARAEAEFLKESLLANGIEVGVASGLADAPMADLTIVPDKAPGMGQADPKRRVAFLATPGRNWIVPSSVNAVIERPLRVRHILALLEKKTSGIHDAPYSAVRRLAGISVLAAEDNEVNRLVLERMLTLEGASLSCVENGRLAFDLICSKGAEGFDVVLTDIQMPEIDGYELSRRINEMYPGLPVIGITAHAMAEERQRCLEAGMVAHIVKPVDIDTLVKTILAHLRQKHTAGTASKNNQEWGVRPRMERTGALETPASTRLAIDWKRLTEHYHHDAGFVAKLKVTVRSSVSAALPALRRAVDGGNNEELSHLAHSLKGTAASLQSDPLHQIAWEAELAAKKGGPGSKETAERLILAAEELEASLGE
ncbi:MAG: PAS domain S-box protein [Rhodospirillales bacterium]|nr:MAG: PAS domain S-box protein [Rhodospirillales bacterium]